MFYWSDCNDGIGIERKQLERARTMGFCIATTIYLLKQQL